jgi:predicted nuclease of predicted toxin-antitoxin system
MKAKLDENLDSRLVEPLRKAGHDATSVVEQELSGIDDESLLNLCKTEGRILVTLDLDFANVLRYPSEDSPGLIVLRGPNQLLSTTQLLVGTLIEALSKESPTGKLWIVEPGRLRIHEERGLA